MKYLDNTHIEDLPGRSLEPNDDFRFRCHPGVACFNRCCHNLNLFLYPYDVVRLKKALRITSDRFLETSVDVVLRPGDYFPDVLLKMKEVPNKPCVFLTPSGCTVYEHRPHTCRLYPLEQGFYFDAVTGKGRIIHLLRPFDFCLGPLEDAPWTPKTWSDDQDAGPFNEMTLLWSDLKRLFQKDPWGKAGLSGPKGKMAFMALYNIDRFREFVFNSTFLKRYAIAPAVADRIRQDDKALLQFAFEWVKFLVWGISGSHFGKSSSQSDPRA